ncbi:hypothetical protein N8I71_16440 [Roseibacterium sp. SDUM158016]|jgi:hypothetical protein|uniref:hypothetical protein n=1 Tax=Roseicyclus sediminis TaxID=2980997 RepID=UPI0021CE05D8|nr:hypothetical protein [Roseibacterium sp. SDUM158016]MCU4654430.1 hypothetical protein [Roseibacterium sp. SDUM158016]
MNVLAGYLGTAGFAWLVLFQLGLAAGLSYGHMAWGGTQRVLPGRLRLASLASAAFAMLGLVTVAQAAGFIAGPLPGIMLRPLLGVFAALFALSVVGNAASKSRAERLHGVPLALVLAVSSGLLAITGGAG